MTMRRKTVVLSISALVIISGSFYGFNEYTRKNKDLVSVSPDVQISATDLIQKFETDETSANKTFLGKKDFIVAVTGQVKEINRDENGYYSIVLGDVNNMSSVRCSMDSLHQQDARDLTKGATVSIKGAFTGFNKDDLLGSDVILNRCVINKNN
jgi:hypothetical protein